MAFQQSFFLTTIGKRSCTSDTKMKGYFYALLSLSVAFTGITVNAQSPQLQGLATPQLLSDDATLQPSQSALDQLKSSMHKLIGQCGFFLPKFYEYMEGQKTNPSFLNQGIDMLTLQVAMDSFYNCCEDMMNVTAAYQIGEAMVESKGTQNPQGQLSPMTAQMNGTPSPRGQPSPMTAQMYGAQNTQGHQSTAAAPSNGGQNSPSQPPSMAITMDGPQNPQS